MKPDLLVFAATFAATTLCFGQEATGLRFEVASIKVTDETRYSANGSIETGRVAWTALTLQGLIGSAWSPDYFDQRRITGPEWLGSTRYAFTARFPIGTTKAQFNEMLEAFLIERFALKFHVNTKEVSGYEIVVAPGGPKLQPASGSEPTPAPATAPGVPPKAKLDDKGFPILRAGTTWSAHGDGDTQRITFARCTMGQLANALSTQYTRTPDNVVDHTDLKNRFDFKLELPALKFSMPDMPAGAPPEVMRELLRDMVPDITLNQVSPQIEKQLGIKVNSVKITKKLFIVDHANREPLEN